MEPEHPARREARRTATGCASVCPYTPGAVDNANSIIPNISKSRRPMDSIPSLGTAPVDATVRQFNGRERPGCVMTGDCRLSLRIQ